MLIRLAEEKALASALVHAPFSAGIFREKPLERPPFRGLLFFRAVRRNCSARIEAQAVNVRTVSEAYPYYVRVIHKAALGKTPFDEGMSPPPENLGKARFVGGVLARDLP